MSFEFSPCPKLFSLIGVETHRFLTHLKILDFSLMADVKCGAVVCAVKNNAARNSSNLHKIVISVYVYYNP